MNTLLSIAITLASLGADRDTLCGTIVNEHDQPVVGATVWLLPLSPNAPFTDVKPTKSDSDGRFTVSCGTSTHGWSLLAHKPGLALGGLRVSAQPTGGLPPGDVRLRLPEPKTIRVRVVDAAGQPSTGVPLRPRTFARFRTLGDESRDLQMYASLPPGLVEQLRVTTNASGEADLDYLSARARFDIRIQTPALGIQGAVLTADASKPTVRLRPVGKVVGRVLADEAEAVREIKVSIRTTPMGDPAAVDTEREASTDVPVFGIAEVVTDGEGRFAVPSIAAGRAIVQTEMPEGSRWASPGATLAEIASGQTVEVEIKLDRAFHVSGRVIDAETGKPVSGGRRRRSTDGRPVGADRMEWLRPWPFRRNRRFVRRGCGHAAGQRSEGPI